MGGNSVCERQAVPVAEQDQPVLLGEFFPKRYETGCFLGSFGRKKPSAVYVLGSKGKDCYFRERIQYVANVRLGSAPTQGNEEKLVLSCFLGPPS